MSSSNSTLSSSSTSSSSSAPFKASADKYICIAFEPEETKELVAATSSLPGTAIPKLHTTIVHSFDAAKDKETMALWDRALALVGNKETVVVKRFKSAKGVLTCAEAIVSVDLEPLIASKVPHISLRLEKGHKAVESRFVIPDDKVEWTDLKDEITLKGTITLMGQHQQKEGKKKPEEKKK